MNHKSTYEELEQRIKSLEQESLKYKQIENKLSQTLQRLNFHIENSPLAVVEFNNCYELTYWSYQAENIFGWKAEEVIGKKIGDFQWVHEEDEQRVAKLSSDMLAGKQTSNVHINRNYRKDGSIITCQWCNSALVDAQGKLISVQSLVLDLTERLEMETKLRISEERFRAYMDNSPGIAWMKDEEGRHVFLSKNYEKRFGIKQDDWLGKTDCELWPLETAQKFRENDLIVLKEGNTIEIVEETQNPDRSTTYWWNFKFQISDTSGHKYVAGYGIDITEKKRIDEELKNYQENLEFQIKERTAELEENNRQLKLEMEERRKAEEQLKKYAEEITDLYENAPCGYHSLSDDGTFLRMNNTGLAWLGYSREEVVGKMKLTDILAPEGKEAFQRDFPLLKKRGWMRNIEDKWIRKDGSLFDVLVNTTAIFDEKGNYLMNRCSTIDNTEYKKAQDALAASEALYRNLFENASIGMFQTTLDGKFLKINKAYANMLGYYSPEEVISKITDVSTQIHADPRIYAELLAELEKKDWVYLESRYLRKDGTHIIGRLGAQKICQPDGTIAYLEGILEDITERKLAEEVLKKSERELRAKTEDLMEVNTTMKVLLNTMENDQKEMKERFLTNIKKQVLPYLEKLEKMPLHEAEIGFIKMARTNLNEISSPFVQKLTSDYLNFTKKEIQIAALIRDGKTSKEIAELLNAKKRVIEFHRENIRRKLGLKNKKGNLATLLRSFS